MVAILACCRRRSRLVCWYARQRLTLTSGVLTGIISSCGSIERLARDHILPPFFLRRIKYTKAPYISIIIFTIIGLAMFAVVNTNLTILSGQFAISFILVMGLFALSNIFLKFNRDRLVRDPHVSLGLVLFALCVVSAAVTGNIVKSPVIVGYFAVFFVVAFVAMTYTGFRGRLATTCIGFIIGIESCILGDGRGIGMSSSLTRSRRVKSNRSCSSPKPMRYFPCHA